jgi:hypothetical protein
MTGIKPESKLPEPKISEDRNIPKTQKQIINDLGEKTFAQEIANDKEKAAVYINRASQAAKQLGEDDSVAKQELASSEVYKRALLLVGAGGLQVNSEDGSSKLAADNNLPASSYLSHGGRIMIEIPPGKSGDDLINWLTSGHRNIDGRSSNQTQNEAIKEGNIVYNRSAATHDVNIVTQAQADGKKQFILEEKKGFMIGARDFIRNKVLGLKTNHYGVDLAMNAEFGGKDPEGKIVNKPDGDHGHLYIHYTPSVNGNPATILIGVEGAAPSSPKHSKFGTPDPVSPVGGSKFGNLRSKKTQLTEGEYKDTVVPKNFGGMVMNLDQKKVHDITAMKSKDYGIELAYSKPGNNPAEFTANLKVEKVNLAESLKKSSARQKSELIDKTSSIQPDSSMKVIRNKLKRIVIKAKQVKTSTKTSLKVIRDNLRKNNEVKNKRMDSVTKDQKESKISKRR